MFDIISYLMGLVGGERHVVLEEGTDYTFTDENSDGNVVMVESEGE